MNIRSGTARRFAVWLVAVAVIISGNVTGQGWLEWVGVALLAALVAVGIWQRFRSADRGCDRHVRDLDRD